jgi:hypothetical protein
MLRHDYQFDGGGHGLVFQSRGSRPVYWSRPADPLVTVHCTYYWGPGTCQGANGFVIDGIKIHIPAGAQPEQQWDGHMLVIDQANNAEYDFERASWSGPNQLTVWSGSEIPISGDTATGLGGSADAGSFGLLAGIIRPTELRANSIDHALAISVPCTEGYVWPAQGPWGEPCGKIGQSDSSGAGFAGLHMGSLLQLNMTDAQIAGTGAPAWQQAIMRAMSHYGMYINDTNGGADNQTLELEKQGDESFTSFGQAPQMAKVVRSLGATAWSSDNWVVDGVPIDVSKLRVVDPCVQQGTCPTAASPPARARPLAHADGLHRSKRVERAERRAPKRHHHVTRRHYRRPPHHGKRHHHNRHRHRHRSSRRGV